MIKILRRGVFFMMHHARQMSESLELGIVLALSGGFMDAYSYMCRGEVFANAQTGNLLLMGIGISEGNFVMARRYLFPVLAFVFGIAIAALVRLHLREKNFVHWRQISVLCEFFVLIGVIFLPQSQNLLANSLTSLACGIQVESFRKIRGNGIATTMCIGNLRNATQNICEYSKEKDKEKLYKGLLYYGVILCFVFGAVCGNAAVKQFHEHAIFVCNILLLTAFFMMFIDREARESDAEDTDCIL
jgi:uncharacterized membrane protein YoaK (UPF0700 family)